LRVLVAIANHGTKNREHLDRLLHEYRSMSLHVDVVVLSDSPKFDLGSDVEVHVGTPTPNPWSLPFAHRKVFADRLEHYDLFIYSEDDTLITEAHLVAFLEMADRLAAHEVPGFLRYEVFPHGGRSYCSVHSGYHWDVASIRFVGDELVADFTNQHSACYVLTQDQLRLAIASGQFLIPPHEGLYDMLVSAATDPYVRCGLRRVLPVTRIDEFLVHHLPNVYLSRLGVGEVEWQAQLAALREVAAGRRSDAVLFDSESRMDTAVWNRKYHERATDVEVRTLRRTVRRVLSVGCGDGRLERQLFGDAELVGIPLDEVIAAVARTRGIATTAPALDDALAELSGEAFDVLFLHDVLGHVADPAAWLSRLRPLLTKQGELVATAPNHPYHSIRYLARRDFAPRPPKRGRYAELGVHRTSRRSLRHWFSSAGLRVEEIAGMGGKQAPGLPRGVQVMFGRTLVVRATVEAEDSARSSQGS
jgi:2-polyprenyl-3-methyl-5-hydroxy-6-metoxy-1,4-benzoquinol methylase